MYLSPILNGTCFTSAQFDEFCKLNGIKHITSSLYHPASNGLAERAVQTVKTALRKTTGNLKDRLYRVLSAYRTTPQTTCGQSPAELIFKRKPRTRFDMVLPSMRNRILERQSNDVQRHNSHEFCIGDSVWCLNFQGSPKWLAGVIEEKLGLVTFSVRLSDNRTWCRHQDNLHSKHPTEETAHTTFVTTGTLCCATATKCPL